MSRPGAGGPPYRVVYSGLCREETRQLLLRARAKGRFAEVAQAVREVQTRREWIPLDFGDPLRDFLRLGIQERIACLGPLVVTYGVDEARRLLYVSVPFKVLPASGL